MKKKEVLILIIPAVVLLAAAAVTVFMIKRESGYTFTADAFQTFGNVESNIPEGTLVSYDKESDELTAECTDTAVEIDSELPAYYRDLMQLAVMKDFICYQPHSGGYGRLDRFSDVHRDSDRSLHLIKKTKDVAVQGGFLYDGRDTYIFLEPVTVEFNRRTYELSAFSYVQAVYGSSVYIYDYDTRTFISDTPVQVPVAYAGSDYSIDLLYDMMTDHQGQRELLLPNPQQQDSIFEQ